MPANLVFRRPIMPVDEIPRDKWGHTCDVFTRQHRGWLACVEAIDRPVRSAEDAGLKSESLEHDYVVPATADESAATATIQRTILMEDVILESVGVGRSPVGDEQLVVTATSRAGKRLTHAIEHPACMRLEHTERGADEALFIDTSSHTVVLRFPITAPMEMLDGFVSD